RGFGFERPHGAVFTNTHPLFVLRSGSMQLSTLRLTRFDATALLSEPWATPPAPGRAAWLPSNMIRLTVQRDDSIPGLARLRPASPLSPGFYVLHDGALI